MKKLILLLLIVLLTITSASAAEYNSAASNLRDLVTDINDPSVITFSDGHFTVYKSIEITTDNFTLDDNIRIDTYAFLDFNSNVISTDCRITGFDSGRNPVQDLRFPVRGYVIVRGDLTMDNTFVRLLGSEYKAACYNEGITVYGNSYVTHSIFEYLRSFEVTSNENVVSDETLKTGIYTVNTFRNSTFVRSNARVYNSVNVNFTDCTFTNSNLRTYNYDSRHAHGHTSVDRCTFTDTNGRQAGDGHYSGIYSSYTSMNITDSTLTDCDISASDGGVNVRTGSIMNGNIILNSARWSTVTDSTIHGAILISGIGSRINITENDISGGRTYGVRIGTTPGFGASGISQLIVSNNEIHSVDTGIAILGAHGNGYHAQIKNNHVYDTNTALLTKYHGYYNWYNYINDNSFDGDVRIENRLQSLNGNTITGTLYVTNSVGDIKLVNNTAAKAEMMNSIDVTFDSCTIPLYNLIEGSNSDTILSTDAINATVDDTISNVSISNTNYTFNGSTSITHDGLNFTVHRGIVTSVYVGNLNGTFSMFKDSVVFIDNIESIDDHVLFTGIVDVGKYSIVESVKWVMEAPKTTRAESGSSAGARYWQNERRKALESAANNTTADVIDIPIPDEVVNHILVEDAPPVVEDILHVQNEKSTGNFVATIINWLRGWFK